MSAEGLTTAEVQRWLDADCQRALGEWIARRVSGSSVPAGGLRATAVSEDYRLLLVAFLARWDGEPTVQLTDTGRRCLGLEPDLAPYAPPPLHYRPLTDAEGRILAALPPGVRRSDQEIAQATGYSRRYVRDLLAGLWHDGLVYKGNANTWIRVA